MLAIDQQNAGPEGTSTLHDVAFIRLLREREKDPLSNPSPVPVDQTDPHYRTERPSSVPRRVSPVGGKKIVSPNRRPSWPYRGFGD